MGLRLVASQKDELRLVRARAADLETYLSFEDDVSLVTNQLHYSQNRKDAQKFFNDNIVRFVAVDGEPVGVIAHTLHAQSHIEITEVAIHPSQQRKRYAYNALKTALSEWRQVPRVSIVLHRGNAIALALYIKVGFAIEEHFLTDGNEPHLRMIWSNRFLVTK